MNVYRVNDLLNERTGNLYSSAPDVLCVVGHRIKKTSHTTEEIVYALAVIIFFTTKFRILLSITKVQQRYGDIGYHFASAFKYIHFARKSYLKIPFFRINLTIEKAVQKMKSFRDLQKWETIQDSQKHAARMTRKAFGMHLGGLQDFTSIPPFRKI